MVVKYFTKEFFVVICMYNKDRSDMAKGKGGAPAPKKSGNDERKNGKASKKRPKVFDAVKRRLVTSK